MTLDLANTEKNDDREGGLSWPRIIGISFAIAIHAAALLLFTMKGHIWWQVALVLGVANVLDSLAGTRLALKHGAGFVRVVFIGVVGALILKTGYDAFLK